MNTDDLTKHATSVLEDFKAQDISVMDVTHLTDVTDSIIVCTATSNRHGRTLADKLQRAAKDQGIPLIGIEGEDDGQWILVDLGDIVVHIMLNEMREQYSLEKLWSVTQTTREQKSS